MNAVDRLLDEVSRGATWLEITLLNGDFLAALPDEQERVESAIDGALTGKLFLRTFANPDGPHVTVRASHIMVCAISTPESRRNIRERQHADREEIRLHREERGWSLTDDDDD